MKIEVKPAANYKTPSYPDMEKASLYPELLKKLPERWRYNKAVVAAIIALSSISVASCNYESSKIDNEYLSTVNDSSISIKQDSSVTSTRSSISKKQDSSVTSTGSKISLKRESSSTSSSSSMPNNSSSEITRTAGTPAPPEFMTEQEALEIIRNEAAKAGIILEGDPKESSVTITSSSYDLKQVTDIQKNPKIDLFSDDKKIAISYVSKRDSVMFFIRGSDKYYNHIHDASGNDLQYSAGVLYDPEKFNEKINDLEKSVFDESGLDYDAKEKKYKEKVENLLEEDLRTQVRDFIEWLRGQGVI